jgi:alpha-tubulin suppressor-like RCC1 family protein
VAALSQVTDAALGHWNSCAKLTTGGVRCWGYDFGSSPGTEISAGVDLVAVGYSFRCVSLVNGPVQCARATGSGQLGNGSIDVEFGRYFRYSYQSVVGIEAGAMSLAAGDTFACAVTALGSVFCWGDNGHGQLDAGSTSSKSTSPLQLHGLESVVQVAAGMQHACAVDESGHVYCWGSNDAGQVGNGAAGDAVRAPERVVGIENAVQVTCGGRHSCALLADGTARWWGSNAEGALGDGTFNDQPLPVVVVEFEIAL